MFCYADKLMYNYVYDIIEYFDINHPIISNKSIKCYQIHLMNYQNIKW